MSIGFRVLVSRHPAIQTTGLLTLAPAGLSPAEHASLRWTHNRTCGSPASGSRTRPHAFVHDTSCRHGVVLVEAAGGGPSMRSAAELIGRRVKLFGLGRIWITRWPRESRRRGRPRRGRFRHAPGGRRSRDGEGRSARLARYGQPPSGGDQLFQPGALIALEQFDHACDLGLGGAPPMLAPPLRSGPPPYLLRSSLSTSSRSCSAKRPSGKLSFLSWNEHPEPKGSRRATPLLPFQHSSGQPRNGCGSPGWRGPCVRSRSAACRDGAC